MSGALEGAGDAVTGGVLARAVEPRAGEVSADQDGAPGNCLNCGAALAGPFCHACGQPAHIHRTVAAWWHDLAHGVLHFEGKVWRTLPMLAWHPGRLTRRYIDGQRARFVSPIALFLFTVFLMFAIFSMLGTSLVDLDEAPARELAAEASRAEAEVARLEARRRAAGEAGRTDPQLEEALRQARAARQAQQAVSGNDGRMFDQDPHTGWARLDAGLKKANENRSLLAYKLQNNAYKFSWALIPISLPFVWLLFLHRRRYRREYKAYDHLVFVTYSISFMSMALIAFVLVRSAGVNNGLLNTLFVLIPPVHIYRQLKGAYALSRFGAAWRTAALLFFALISALLFLLLLLALGVLT
ncbi:MAG TPA: DUF3667 domain-containing protein [Allosphingosinicella sp.]|nr:DUF3667 domain-containing protein [Allosphingosinicella sp.]